MTSQYDGFIRLPDANLHYLEYRSDGPALLLLHSLTANAHVFHGLIAHGLQQYYRLVIPDLRGRGASDHPASGYSLDQQARDVIALLDALQITSAAVCGHSFGGLLGIYLAAHYPDRVNGLVLLDAAVSLNPLTPFLISYSTARLLHTYPSWDLYLHLVMHAPFMDRWDAAMLPFLKADVKEQPDGTVAPASSWLDVSKAAAEVFSVSERDWRSFISAVKCPALLLYANAPFVHAQHIVTKDKVAETVALLSDGEDLEVEGNHFTMWSRPDCAGARRLAEPTT